VSEFYLRTGRECFVIMPSGIAHQWQLRENCSFTDDDLMFIPGQRELFNPRFKRLPCIQQARAKQMNQHDYYTVFLREARHSGETYLLAVHLTENDTDDD
jgi:hypothetical protein